MGSLSAYKGKRDFSATAEPHAKVAGGTKTRFVVQKHDASRMHYDFRLEHGGVLWSWAVTKGPSLDPATKRLAVRTEDHPVAYADFEGTIPKGEYGAGTVMLWDTGWWEPLHDPDEGMKEGKLHIRLHGARMLGGWALVRTSSDDAKEEEWLLIKERDTHAGSSENALLDRNRSSVRTGRTMREIAAGKPAFDCPKDHSSPRPPFRDVQLATLHQKPPEGDGWRHEAKFDGYRCLLAIGKGGIRFYTRNGKDWSDRFAALYDAANALACKSALIDGEVIAGPGGGDFSTLQKALKSGDPLVLYVFDILEHDGTDLAGDPLEKRRDHLQAILKGQPARGPIHVIVPLRRTANWDEVAAFAKTFAKTLAKRDPDNYSATMSKSSRKGRIFIDWLRNERGATAIAPYALRARPGAPVAMPVSWEELGTLGAANTFRIGQIEDRLSTPCPLTRPQPKSIGKQVREALDDWSDG